MTLSPEPPRGVPWERRSELGWLRALIDTIGESLLHPVAFFRKLDPAGPILPAILYAMLLSVAGFVGAAVWQVAFPIPFFGFPPPLQTGEAAAWSLGLMLSVGLVGLVLTPLFLVVIAAVYHLVLLVLGGPSKGYGATLRVIAYSSGPQVFQLVPFCGALLTFGWSMVLLVIGLREVHGIQTGKAVAVILIPLLLCVVVVAALFTILLVTVGVGALAR